MERIQPRATLIRKVPLNRPPRNLSPKEKQGPTRTTLVSSAMSRSFFGVFLLFKELPRRLFQASAPKLDGCWPAGQAHGISALHKATW